MLDFIQDAARFGRNMHGITFDRNQRWKSKIEIKDRNQRSKKRGRAGDKFVWKNFEGFKLSSLEGGGLVSGVPAKSGVR